jgi:alpha-galactosidase
MRALLVVSLLVASTPVVAADGLALTPPMGWNSWNKFGCDVSEKLIKEMADALVSTGMKDAGYQYLVIDDCWQVRRDAQGRIVPDPDRFSSGMKALADYVHGKGLKFGVYSDAGTSTCAKRPGSKDHEAIDARTYAEWGVDYLKYDWCDTQGLKAEGAYLTMREALRKAGRPVLFSICEWGDNKPWDWAKPVGHSWRTTGDIWDCFDCVEDHGTWQSRGVLQILDLQNGLRVHAGPDHWNDADMMEVGNGGMTTSEDRAHFTIWSMLASPLIAGNDIRNMSKETAAILTNKSVIAINQDPLGVQAFKYAARDGVDYWFKPLEGGDWAFMALNRNKEPRKISFDWKAENVNDDLSRRDAAFGKTNYRLRNLWNGRFVGNTGKALSAEVPGHDVLMLRLQSAR